MSNIMPSVINAAHWIDYNNDLDDVLSLQMKSYITIQTWEIESKFLMQAYFQCVSTLGFIEYSLTERMENK